MSCGIGYQDCLDLTSSSRQCFYGTLHFSFLETFQNKDIDGTIFVFCVLNKIPLHYNTNNNTQRKLFKKKLFLYINVDIMGRRRLNNSLCIFYLQQRRWILSSSDLFFRLSYYLYRKKIIHYRDYSVHIKCYCYYFEVGNYL